jgi:hypothetical protein
MPAASLHRLSSRPGRTWLSLSVLILGVMGLSRPAFSQLPVQTYFVPLPEDVLLTDTFRGINSSVTGPVNSLISVAIAADNTIIWYDHWEDGYESDVKAPTQATTEIWGDGDVSNGAPPGVATNAADVLLSGDAIVLENRVPTPRDPTQILFDGRDRIQASFPIAVTRGAFPEGAGSLFAGAVEVLETDSWGTQFVAPVGEDTVDGSNDPFEYSALYVMAREDGTVVTLPGGTTQTLNRGDNVLVPDVNQGDVVSADSPVQVDLLSGDVGSTYEMRWYSLLPREDWTNDYYTPVGDGDDGPTRVWLYNPNDSDITVSYDFQGGGTPDGPLLVPAGRTLRSPPIPDGSGARFSAAQQFFALTQTDIEGEGRQLSGEIFDWGHPLLPADQLTSQALIGWGYGCTNNNCNQSTDISTTSRSVVWVTPVADATLNVDFDGNGVIDRTIPASALDSVKIVDTADEDMTGALIFARDALNTEGTQVNIAVAWGQDPERSGSGDSGALDLGTTVPPLPILEASKTVELVDDADGDGKFSPGDTVLYTIQIVNIGQVDFPAGSWNLLDYASPLFDDATYVPGSTEYDDGITVTVIADDTVPPASTVFPLDVDGLDSISLLPKRGGAHEVSFRATIVSFEALTPGTKTIINNGVIQPPGGGRPLDEFEVETPLNFEPAIDIQKTVYVGHDGGASCPGSELATGVSGAPVTYCFAVTNIGNTFLSDIQVNDPRLGTPVGTIPGPLAPNATGTLFLESTIDGDLTNEATATANPTYFDGTDLPDEEDVTDSDTADVEVLAGGGGCTPGYWKQRQHSDSWVGYTPDEAFGSVFDDAFPGKTLLQVLKQGGGHLKALGRHTVAALLNAATPDVGYDMSESEVISAFNAAFASGNYEAQKNIFASYNEQGCPLN